jgi:hypothetical protein
MGYLESRSDLVFPGRLVGGPSGRWLSGQGTQVIGRRREMGACDEVGQWDLPGVQVSYAIGDARADPMAC